VAIKKSGLTAVHKLELSKINQNQIQRELMGDDLDLGKLVVYLKSQILFDTTDRVIDVQVNRTIDGASTLDLTLNDYDRSILRSWALNAKLDIQIDGMWFRLVSCSKSANSDELQLTFEQREIALLRSYPKPDTTEYTIENAKKWVKWASRDKVTRAQFILNLIREVKEVKIPVVIPHLAEVQPILKSTDVASAYSPGSTVASSGGIPADYNSQKSVPSVGKEQFRFTKGYGIVKKQHVLLYSKTDIASREQIQNVNTIISVGVNRGARRKVLVCAIMVAIDESNLYNLSGGDLDSVGLFQQRASWGSYADRHDPATAAGKFYDQAIKMDAAQSGLSFNDLCQLVQKSGTPDAYGQWRPHAEAFVSAYGIPPGGEGDTITGGTSGTTEGSAASANAMGQTWTSSGSDGSFYYYRGIPPTRNKGWWKREDNWTCIQRLASEVGWRAFFIGGVFYFLTDDDLFKTQPIATINEGTPGVMGIGFDYDIGRKGATVDLPCQVGLWLAPPGSVIVLTQLGPLDGRWIVNSFSRSLFDSNADVQLMKPSPKLLEPSPKSETFKKPTWANDTPPTPPPYNGTNSALFGGLPGMNNGSREAVVAVAQRALEIQAKWPYDYAHTWETGIHAPRPIPNSLWGQKAHDALDCSAFAILCYKEAGCADPSGNNYNGDGFTGDIARTGDPVIAPEPGDLALYGSPPDYEHVGVYIGNGQNIEIGGDIGIHQESTTIGGRIPSFRSFLPR
jgi:hypothetical protein